VILDGICQYVGPGSVFENCWDLAGALQVEYSEQNIQADVVTLKLKLRTMGSRRLFMMSGVDIRTRTFFSITSIVRLPGS
jgi:hypothetical protein